MDQMTDVVAVGLQQSQLNYSMCYSPRLSTIPLPLMDQLPTF